MTRVVLNQAAIRELENDRKLADELRPSAAKVMSRAQGRAPRWPVTASWVWFTRAGVGPQGAYAQAIVRGSGTVAAEYGGSRSPAYAFLRSSL
jgi:hypothetical protein